MKLFSYFHNKFVKNISTAEVKIQSFIRLLCLNSTVCQYSSLLQPANEQNMKNINLVGITRKANLCLTCHKSSLFVSSLILQGKHVEDVHRGRTEGEKLGDDWQITFPVSFLIFSLFFPSIPFPSCCNVSRDCSLTTYKLMIVVSLFLYHEMHEMFCYFVILLQSNTTLFQGLLGCHPFYWWLFCTTDVIF